MGGFDQRRCVAELKPIADDCAKLHATALVALYRSPRGTAAGNNRRPAWLRLARHASRNLRIFRALTGSASSKYSEPKPVNFKPVGLKGVSGMQQSRSLHCFGDNPAASAAHFTQTFQCQRVEGERRRDDILSADFVWQT